MAGIFLVPNSQMIRFLALGCVLTAILPGQAAQNGAIGAGGPGTSAHAVRSSLDWLLSQQDRNGALRSAPGQPVGDVGLTALAVMAATTDGQTHKEGPHTALVRKGVGFLLEQQDKSGVFGGRSSKTWQLDHALATHAVMEVCVMGQSSRLVPRLKGAIPPLLSCKSKDARVLTIQLLLVTVQDAAYWGFEAKAEVTKIRERLADEVTPAGPARLDACRLLLAYMQDRLPRAKKGPLHAAAARLVQSGSKLLADDGADPMAALMAAWAVHQVGDAEYGAFSRSFVRGLIKSQGKDGSWQAAVKSEQSDKAAQQAATCYLTAMRSMTLWAFSTFTRTKVRAPKSKRDN